MRCAKVVAPMLVLMLAVSAIPESAATTVHVDFEITQSEVLPPASSTIILLSPLVANLGLEPGTWDTASVFDVTFDTGTNQIPLSTATNFIREIQLNSSTCYSNPAWGIEIGPAQDFDYVYDRNDVYYFEYYHGYLYENPAIQTHTIDIGASGCGIVEEGTLLFEMLPGGPIVGDPVEYPPTPLTGEVKARFTVELRYLDEPQIRSISDVGNDQGGQVRIRWLKSLHDAAGDTALITDYEIYRRQDQYLKDDATNRKLDGWDFIGTVPAHWDSIYQLVVPTLCDSTAAGGICVSAFFVRAATGSPGIYFDSAVDSGYSVDNLAPSPPVNLRMPSATGLAWDECEADDFDYFSVYGSEFSELDSTAALIGYTVGTELDVSSDVYQYYRVTATDFSGNEGDASSIGNPYAGVGDIEVLPTVFALRQGNPNPFEKKTSISFDVPFACAVRIQVFDAEGRLVNTLSDRAYPVGCHTLDWLGDDDDGRMLSAGVYFMKIEAGELEATQKMILMR